MFIPLLTKRSESNKKLYRRKGGGGGGGAKGGGGGGKSGGSSSGKGSTKSVPVPNVSTGKGSATAYGRGSSKVTTITSGLFVGRTQGGGTRGDVFGTRMYGSGYPGVTGRGVSGRGFPYYFWPVVWVGGSGNNNNAYLYNKEYGDPNNSSRPGGPMAQANFISNATGTTFRLYADNSTVTSLISSITENCTSSNLSPSSSKSAMLINTSDPNTPKPEQAVQYYRASSVVLTLDGYNNTAVLSDDSNAVDTPLPSGTDTTLLYCLNQTIGLAVPLVDAAGARWSTPSAAVIVVFWVVWFLLGNTF